MDLYLRFAAKVEAEEWIETTFQVRLNPKWSGGDFGTNGFIANT
jgi:hypothetical protein